MAITHCILVAGFAQTSIIYKMFHLIFMMKIIQSVEQKF